jgi:phosphatidylinositol 3-kinase
MANTVIFDYLKGDSYARSIYEHILNQEKFLKALNDVVRATSRENNARDKKVLKLRSLLNDTSKSFPSPLTSSSTVDLVNFGTQLPLIIDPSVRSIGINVEKTTMFSSNLMPCKFVFRTLESAASPASSLANPQGGSEQASLSSSSNKVQSEYSTIYKIGDDLRQDQLVLQMIALMDKLLKQENLDLKLTPYKVIATGIKEGFLQFVDAVPLTQILNDSKNGKSIQGYLRTHNPSETDKYGVRSEVMDNYVRSCGKMNSTFSTFQPFLDKPKLFKFSQAGYMIITYILGVGDRHNDNILMTKCGKILHIDFGYILGREPKPFQPTIKWTKDMADGMGGRYAPDGTENKEMKDFKTYCGHAFLHLRR